MTKKLLFIAILLFLVNSIYSQNNTLNFDASSSYVLLPDAANFRNDTYTIELWFKAEKTGFQFLTIKSNSWNVMINSNNNILFTHTGGNSVTSTSSVTVNQWTHVAAVYNNSNNTAKLYVNGFLEASATGVNMSANSAGSTNISNNGGGLLGNIDEYRIWNDERTQTEINEDMYKSLLGSEANLVAYYNFNSGTAGGNNAGITTLNDLTSNNLDGTLNNFALTGSTTNWVSSELVLFNSASASIYSNLPPTVGLLIGNVWVGDYSDQFDGNTDVSVVEADEISSGTLPPSTTSNIAKTWMINGDPDAGTFSLDLTFDNLSFTSEEQSIPSLVKLFYRPFHSSGTWTESYDASVVTSTSAQFEGITSFGQFMIAICYPSVTLNRTTINFGSVIVSNPTEQTYTVSGDYLFDDLIITAPSGFEVSTTSGSGFSSSLSLSPVSRQIASTTIYLKYTSSAIGYTGSQSLAHSSTLMTTTNINVTTYGINGYNDWHELGMSTRPSGRYGEKMAYISDGKVLLYGGLRGTTVLSDTWLFDYNTNSWTQLTPSSSPGSRWIHDMAYIGDDKVLFFGGAPGTGSSNNNDTWVYDLSDNTWTNKNPSNPPAARRFHKMSYIGDDKVLLFGGSWDRSDTWLYDLSDNTWTQLSPAQSPPGRDGHGMSYIGDDKVVIFGGYYSRSDTWVFDLSDNTWTNMNPTNNPSGRYEINMAYMGGDQVLMYGGNGKRTDTWVYDLSDNTWINDQNDFNPDGNTLYGLAMTSLDGSKEVLLYGGKSTSSNNDNVCLLFGNGDFMSRTNFTKVNANIVNTSEGSVDWGDYDNDSYLDILISGSGTTRIYHNNGDETFTDISAGITGADKSEAKWGDYDSDGDLDFAIVKSGESLIYRNDGNNVFTNISAGLSGLDEGSMDWGDYDNDGDLDLVIIGKVGNSGAIRLYKNNGSDSFEYIDIGLSGAYTGSIEFGDYDNDGDLDLLISGLISGINAINEIYRNEGNDVFTDINANLVSTYFGGATWGDYDNDGDLDILLFGSNSGTKTTRIYKNNNGTFAQITTQMDDAYYGEVKWGDYDNDGDLDVLMMGRTGDVITAFIKIFENNGSDNFAEVSTNFTASYNGGIAWGDYDNDGDLDVLTAAGIGSGGTSPTTNLYKNNSIRPNTKPNKPSNLQSNVTNGVLTLTWNKATGNTTPQNGLSYNIRLGSASGLSNIVAAQANDTVASTNFGKRRLAAHELAYRSAGIKYNYYYWPAGTFYWSVQAIDHTFTGSEFADEQTIEIPGIGGRVWADANANGIQDAGEEAVEGIEIGLYNSSDVLLATRVSDVKGEYSFAVPNGDYYFKATLSSELSVSQQNNSGDDSTDSDYDPANNQSDLVTFSGTSVLNVDLGIKYIYVESNATIEGLTQNSIAVADYDADNYIDFIQSGTDNTNAKTILYKNNQSGGFTQVSTNIINLKNASSDWGDFDNDGDVDLVISGTTDSNKDTTLVYSNNNGVFTDIGASLAPASSGQVSWGDYDNDGDLDLLISGNYTATKIYTNNGNNTFSDSQIALTGLKNGSAQWFDIDKDGYLDFIITGSSVALLGETLIYKNNGDGTFTNTQFDDEQYTISYIAIADFNKDGYPDFMAMATENSNNYILYYQNNQDGTFTKQSNDFEALGSGSIMSVDFNNDGNVDLFYYGEDQSSNKISKLYQNNGDGTFSALANCFWEKSSGTVASADFDNDGDIDIILSAEGTSGLEAKLYTNELNHGNTSPNVPTNLQSTYSASNLTVSWNNATDTESPAELASYNVKIGTSSGGNEVLSSNSDNSGNRLLFKKGNAGNRTSFTLNGFGSYQLPTIYWSVQSVDHLGKPSAFSIEANRFSLPQLPDLLNESSLDDAGLLQWQTDQSPYLTGFIVQIDNNSDFSSVEINDTIAYSDGVVYTYGTDSYFTISINQLSDYNNLVNDNHYYWRMRPVYSMPWAKNTIFSALDRDFYYNPDGEFAAATNGIPTGTIVAITTTEISWDAPVSATPKDYAVYLFSSADNYSVPIIDSATTVSTNYPVSNLHYNITYKVIVLTNYSVTSDTYSASYEWYFKTVGDPGTAPTVITQDITVALDASGNVNITADEVDNGSTDDEGIASFTLDKTNFDCSNIGENTVTLTATDYSGNTATGTAIVTVADNLAPVLECAGDTTITINEGDQFVVAGTVLDPVASDNCSFTLSNDFNSGSSLNNSTLPTGKTLVNWTITDNSGNNATCSQTITVVIDTTVNNQIDITELSVYPNPTGGKFTIKLIDEDLWNIKSSVEVLNSTGNKILTQEFNGNKTDVDISGNGKGVYFIRVIINNSSIITKRIVLN